MSLARTKPDRRWLDTVVDTVRVSPVTGGVARMGKKVRALSSYRLRRRQPFVLLSAGLGAGRGAGRPRTCDLAVMSRLL
jgi:hypothetical protein